MFVKILKTVICLLAVSTIYLQKMPAMFIFTGFKSQLDQICKPEVFAKARTLKANDQFSQTTCCKYQT